VSTDPVPPQEEETAPGEPPPPPVARRRLRRLSGPRVSRGTMLVAVLTLLLGVALVAQVRTTQSEGLEDLRESDLIALLDDASTRVDTLEEELASLESDRARLQGASGDAAAQQAAEDRLDSYRVLAGTVPVEGPGVTVVVGDADRAVTPTMVLDLIQELRDAGAEAIQVGPVRVVASSWVGLSAENELTVDGQPLTSPYRIVAIGDGHTLAGALAIPGGFNDSVRRVGGTVEVVEGETLRIDALHQPEEPRYARPVPSEDA
jgi:uncharacterized protein YlxW (UPF0749 family)